MVAIPFPLTTTPGVRPAESAGRLINARAEPLGEGARGAARRVRVPGLATFATSSQTGPRGTILVGANLFAAFSGAVYRVTTAGGAMTSVGTLAGTLPVYWARNNKSPTPDIVCVSENGAFSVATGSVSSFADVDLPQPNSVCFMDGYFFFTIGDGRCFASGINDVTIDALHFTTAEGKPDTLLRPIPFGTTLFLFGSQSTEAYLNTANPTGFPFSRAAVISLGLLTATAITGFEDGFGFGLIFVGNDYGVHRMNGYAPEKISPSDLDRLIEAVSDKTTLEMCSYVTAGQPMVVLSSPTWTWEHNLATGKWNERESWASGEPQGRWRGQYAVSAFDKWIVQDDLGGNLRQVTSTAYSEVTEPLIWEVESAPVANFPNRVQVARADFDFTTGVGVATGTDPNQTDPTVGISWSDDGGTRWSNPLFRKLGRQNKATQRVSVLNTGLSGPQGRRWRLRVSDAVYVSLIGGEQHADVRAL